MNSDYDQVYLVPTEVSKLSHRSEVDLHSNFADLYPIMSSPMAGISGSRLVIEMGKNNCLGILHRFQKNYEDRIDEINLISEANIPFGVAIGLEDFNFELKIAEIAVEKDALLICLDLANGYMARLKEAGKQLREWFPNTKLMCGNVVDPVGVEHLRDAGFDLVRIGIGNGSLCSTRLATGVGRNQLAALEECSEIGDVDLVSDGGITIPANAVKSFAAGARFVMIGSAFGRAIEAENTDGIVYGMASLKNHTNTNKRIQSIEGIEKQIVEQKVPLKEILDQFLWGIRSACTYMNCLSYEDLYYKATFKPVSENVWE